MSAVLINLYRWLFLRKRCYRFNRFVFNLALRGMGIFNYETDRLSGEKWFLETFCKGKLKVALDVGGNVGHYAEMIVQHNPGVRVFSFEPHPTTFKTLSASADKLGYKAMNLALGGEQGFIDLYDYAAVDGSQHASVYQGVIEDVHGSKSVRHRVSMTTLDAFMAEHGIDRVDLLKIDTEGNEYQVLKGAPSALDRGAIELIHFEFNVTNVISRVFMKDFYELLADYRLYRMLPDGLVRLRDYGSDMVDVEIFGFQNIVAIRKDSPLLSSLSP